jgi:hypothetical protein
MIFSFIYSIKNICTSTQVRSIEPKAFKALLQKYTQVGTSFTLRVQRTQC